MAMACARRQGALQKKWLGLPMGAPLLPMPSLGVKLVHLGVGHVLHEVPP